MDKIEKIRQEIERLKGVVTTTIKELRMPEPSERMCGELDAYDDILWFLDTLEEEPDKDLEEAAEEYIKKGRYLPEAFIVRPAFIAGAKWQAEQDKETIELAEDHAFLAGSNWQAEQFAKIIRANLSEIGKDAQSQFEKLYFEITGTKIYGGYND